MQTSIFNKLPQTKQLAILDASARIFAEKGYFQAGINEICQAAAISNGALYKYFENKKGLFIATASRTMELLASVAEKAATGEMTIWERLRSVLQEVVPFITTNRDYFIIYMDLGSPSLDEFASELSDRFERLAFDFFYQTIEKARENGEIRRGIKTETAAYSIDNHLMLFAFSCVSKHYDRRFHQYFGRGLSRLNVDQKVEIMMQSFRQILQ